MNHLSRNLDMDRKIYGNCKVLSPENILMFRCDFKKANWYLSRNLGEVVEEEPLTIRLKFEPKGLGNHNKEWGLSEMSNKCVVCGDKEFLTKHHVVPHSYRRFFPIEIKSHNFHDVLSVCVGCHADYELMADDLKLEISENFDAPLSGEVSISNMMKHIRMASTLLRDDIKIPKNRIIEMRNFIKSFFGIKRLTNSRLSRISNLKDRTTIKTHGEIVVDKLNGDLQDFVEMWRSHFIEKMNPKFLPEKWKINKIVGK